MSFASDAQRKHFFANGGGAAGGAIPNFVQPGGHWHTMTVCGVEKNVWIDHSQENEYEPGKLIASWKKKIARVVKCKL